MVKLLNPDWMRHRTFFLNFGYCPKQIYLKLKTLKKVQVYLISSTTNNFLAGLILLL